MQLYQLIFYVILSALTVFAEEVVDRGSNETAQNESQFIDFNVTYNIVEKPAFDPSAGLEFSMEEIATFNYSFTNNENSNISVIGVAGTVIANPEGYQVANITEQSVGPVPIAVNETANFQSGIQLLLPEGAFYLLPVLFILKDEKVMKIGIRPLLINVNPPPMSLLNPSFLSVQILLGLLIAAATYVFLALKKPDPRKKTSEKVSLGPVDHSWLPDTYKTPKNPLK
ncbi:IRC22 (YEL001C) [Zygosaccharomyces parabailii]|nr:IRC22 (YEL001C) [Zygosaccharomyces parabailii]CDH17277.1 related to Increased recombination centers protein 22 [Zygosaccharomyces bailii ISA1307]